MYKEHVSLHVWEIPVAMDAKHDDVFQVAQFWSVDRKRPLYITYIVSLSRKWHRLD
jgi:hypothetical protein